VRISTHITAWLGVKPLRSRNCVNGDTSLACSTEFWMLVGLADSLVKLDGFVTGRMTLKHTVVADCFLELIDADENSFVCFRLRTLESAGVHQIGFMRAGCVLRLGTWPFDG